MAKVILESVSKVYRDTRGKEVRAVDNVSLEIQDQEFMVLVGPSGCGKSTTLRMVAGLEEISSGKILIDGQVANDVPPRDRDIAMVFQNYALYPHMSVYKNMAFGLMLRKLQQAEIDRRVAEAADMLGIKDLLDRRPKELSGGQRQRVAVGRAIVRKAKAFLFDEPLSNLDAKLRVQMRTELSKLHSRLNATMIYVTHDQVEAMTMGDRITVMHLGKIQQVATPLEVYSHPKNVFVAGFIGSPTINFFQGTLQQKDRKFAFIETTAAGGAGFSVPVDPGHATRLQGYAGKPIRMGVRPEAIRDHRGGSAEAGGIVQATVEVVEPMGSEVYLYVNTGSHTFTARVATAEKTAVNHKLDLVFDMKRAHFFDPTTDETVV